MVPGECGGIGRFAQVRVSTEPHLATEQQPEYGFVTHHHPNLEERIVRRTKPFLKGGTRWIMSHFRKNWRLQIAILPVVQVSRQRNV